MDEAPLPAGESAALDPALRSDVERCVGRNLLVYQGIENVLKGLLLGSILEGTRADLAARMAERATRVMRLNMGDVAKAVFDQVLTADPKELPMKAEPTEVWHRMQFRIGPPADRPDAFEQLRDRCKVIVDQRNDLVHHFLSQCPRETDGDLRAAIEALDVQHGAAVGLRGELVELLRAHETQRATGAAWLASTEYRGVLTTAMAQGNVVNMLADTAQRERRADGWTFVTTALHRLNGSVTADVQLLKERLGRDWLRITFERASEIFEIAREPLPNSAPPASRDLYRLRDEEPGTDRR